MKFLGSHAILRAKASISAPSSSTALPPSDAARATQRRSCGLKASGIRRLPSSWRSSLDGFIISGRLRPLGAAAAAQALSGCRSNKGI